MFNHPSGFRCRFLATILVMGCLMVNRANAALETETVTESLSPSYTDFTDSVAVPQFDPSLGMLQSVTITAKATGQFTQFYQNRSTRSKGSVTIRQDLEIILDLPSGGSLDLSQTEKHTYSRIPVYDGSPYFTGPSSGSRTYAVTAEKTKVLKSGLAQFTGSGFAIFLVAATSSGSSRDSNGNFLVGWSTLAGLNLCVTYCYAAVPEPTTWTWLAGVSAVASLFISLNQRRLKSQ